MEANEQLNFKNLFDNDNDIYISNHYCEYVEINQISNLTKTDNFSSYSHNVRSLSGHFDDLVDLLDQAKPHKFSVIALQEVWSINREYNIPTYHKLEYCTRDMSEPLPNPNCGGGVGLFIDSKFSYEILSVESSFIPGVYESIWVKVEVSKGIYKIIGNVYRPNTAPLADLARAISTHVNIIQSLKSSKDHKNCDFQILSDFNVNILNFAQHELTNTYIESMFSLGLLPVITRPTRLHHMSATLIDHIFESNQLKGYIAGIIISSLSDHFPTFYIEQCTTKKLILKPFKSRIINEETIPGYENILKTAPWGNVIKDEPKLAFDNFFQILDDSRDVAFPEVNVKPKPSLSFRSPWMSIGLLISSKTKTKLFSKKIKKPSQLNDVKFKTYNNLFNKCKKAAKNSFYFKQFEMHKENIKQTWTLIRDVIGSQTKKRESLPNFFRQNKDILSDPTDISNGFNDFFVTVGSKLASEIQPSGRSFRSYLKEHDSMFKFSSVSEVTILEFVKIMKPKTSAGVDCVSNKLLKRIVPIIIGPLHYLINISLQTGFVPQQIKVSKIIPLYKINSGDKHNFSNYRPILILSSFAKLIEKIVCSQLINYLNNNDLLYKHQYGFRGKHGTSHPLIHFTNNVQNALNNNKINLSIFIDLKKAFDTVNFDILLDKLNSYGIKNTENNWFTNYLANRVQFVQLPCGTLSQERVITCGVPQGSVAGPLLFLIYINDLPNATDLFTILFADDTTFQFSSEDADFLAYKVNLELQKASEWFSANLLTLNAKKTKYILYKNQSCHLHLGELFIGGEAISRVGESCKEKSFKFLGHHLDENLTWVHHTNHVHKKLVSANFALSRSKAFLPSRILQNIYRSLFESHLHFGSIVWGCARPNILNKLFIQQKKAIRHVKHLKFNAHTSASFKQLEYLKLQDLIQFNQAVFIRNYSNKKLPYSFNNMYSTVPESVVRRSRDDDYNYLSPQIKYANLHYFPSSQLIYNWNNLPLLIKSVSEPSEFRSELKRFLISKYETDCYLPNCYSCY